MSFGSTAEAGDGLNDDARWVDGLMDPGHAPGPNNFPNGAIVVMAAGNEGDINDRLVARIVVPAAGEITLPVELKDTRGALNTRWKECAQRPHHPDIGVHFWFRRAAGVRFALKLPRAASFGTNVLLGGTLTVGFRPNVGAAPTLVAPSSSVHRATISHEDPGAVPHPSGSTVHRHHVHFYVEPKRSGATVSYHTGIYEMRIQAPAGTEIFATCEEDFWAAGKNVAFGIAATMFDGSALPAAITVTSEFSSTDTLGQHAITVAAYDETNSRNIASFSSRGPLRDYSDPAAPLAVIAKPEIAAPGVEISSAEGLDTEALLPRLPLWTAGNRFAPHGGTSMAAPMVAGVIALLLDKKSDLTVAEARTFMSSTARAAVSPAAPPASTRAYGSGMVSALESHIAIP
jgi:subtilisin family serine protease